MSKLGQMILSQLRTKNGSAKPILDHILKEQIYAEGPNGMGDLSCSPCDGGPHMHRLKPLAGNKWLVVSDHSNHRHEVEVGDRTTFTEDDGQHTHTALTSDRESAPESKHTHQVIIGGVLHESGPGSAHSHELLSGGTAFDGSHQHTFTIDAKKIKTTTPADERAERQARTEKR